MKKLLEWFVKTTTADVYMNCVIDQNWRWHHRVSTRSALPLRRWLVFIIS